MPTIQEMRDLVGEDLPDPDPLDPAHLRWAGKLLAAFDTPNAQYRIRATSSTPQTRSGRSTPQTRSGRRSSAQVEAMAKAIFARR